MSDAPYSWRPAATAALRQLAVATLAGAIVGFLVGGVGGRLAMSLLASLNAEDAGVVSDDGFTMGQVTLSGTLNLLLVGTVLGALGGVIFLAVRALRIGPSWFQVPSVAIGAMVISGKLRDWIRDNPVFRSWLEREKLPKASLDFALGEEKFRRLLAETELVDLPPEKKKALLEYLKTL